MKSNKFLENLYDMAESKDDQGMSKFDEQKLRKSMEGNKQLMGKNKDMFAEGEPKFHTCKRYDPCPICDKCLNKASHLYVSCQECQIPICVHTYADRNKMIRRDNFEIPVSKEVMEELKAKANKVLEGK